MISDIHPQRFRIVQRDSDGLMVRIKIETLKEGEYLANMFLLPLEFDFLRDVDVVIRSVRGVCDRNSDMSSHNSCPSFWGIA